MSFACPESISLRIFFFIYDASFNLCTNLVQGAVFCPFIGDNTETQREQLVSLGPGSEMRDVSPACGPSR